MKIFTSKQVIAASVLAFGFIAVSHAAPVFKVDTSLFDGASAKTFEADFINGTASTLLQASGSQVNGRGYTQLTTFQLGSNVYTGEQSGLNSTYRLWAEYTFTTTLNGGSLVPGVENTVTSLSINLFGDKIGDTEPTFTAANINNLNSAIVVGPKTLLGTGVLDTTAQNVASINSASGTSLNAKSIFSLVDPAGSSFFIEPQPFYDFVFSSFTNTSNGVVFSPDFDLVSINQASGGVDFNSNSVPEPGSIALLGAALIGMAALRRRKTSV